MWPRQGSRVAFWLRDIWSSASFQVLPSACTVCQRIPSKLTLARGAVMQAWRNDSTTRGNHVFTIHQGLIVQMGGEGGWGARRPARDHASKSRPGDGMMAWCHRALHIRHYQATSNSQSKVLDCGACRVPCLWWHCCEPFTVLTLEIDVLRSAHGWNLPLFALCWVGELAREQRGKGGKQNRKPLLPLFFFFVCQGLPRSEVSYWIFGSSWKLSGETVNKARLLVNFHIPASSQWKWRVQCFSLWCEASVLNIKWHADTSQGGVASGHDAAIELFWAECLAQR